MSELNVISIGKDLTPKELNALDPLNGEARRILDVIEQFFWSSKKILNSDQVSKLLKADLPKIQAIMNHPTFIAALRAKGIITSTEYTGILTSRQILAANMVLTRADSRSLREKLKEVGVTISEWNAWMASKSFAEYVTGKSEADLGTSNHIAFNTILSAVENGDTQAAKLLLEINNRYSQKVDVNVNIGIFMTQVIEIIANYLPAETLEEIASKLEALQSAHLGVAASASSRLIDGI